MRENTGEIEAAITTTTKTSFIKRHSRLPKLIDYEIGNNNSLKGDLQMHTNWTDGNNSILEMAEAAKKVGLEYIAITDHSKSLGIAGGLHEEDFARQSKEIEKVNATIHMNNDYSTDHKDKAKPTIKVLKGVEVNILKDGSLDLKNNILKEFDVVGASIHSYFNLPREEQTKRLISAMYNPHVDIIYHPTGRIINRREPYDIDIEQIIHTAKDTNTTLEVDSYPDRLDLKDEYIRIAIENGCKICIDSDAHDKSHLQFHKFGIAQARRGWAEKQDIVNTLHLEKFTGSLKK
jgi:DNA polymerase (family X)